MNFYADYILNHPKFKTLNIVRDMDLLYPPFRLKVEDLVKTANEGGLHVAVFETYRSNERQRRLFLTGKSGILKNGMHHYGVAADVVFLDRNGLWTWNMPTKDWRALGQIGKGLGLVWGGDWKKFVDSVHFQFIPVAEQNLIRRGIYPA